MDITINMYAGLKDFFGLQVVMQLPENSKVSDILNKLLGEEPAASDILSYCRFAVNNEFVEFTQPVAENSVVDIMPPFSGG